MNKNEIEKELEFFFNLVAEEKKKQKEEFEELVSDSEIFSVRVSNIDTTYNATVGVSLQWKEIY